MDAILTLRRFCRAMACCSELLKRRYFWPSEILRSLVHAFACRKDQALHPHQQICQAILSQAKRQAKREFEKHMRSQHKNIEKQPRKMEKGSFVAKKPNPYKPTPLMLEHRV